MITHEFELDMVPGAVNVEQWLNQYDSDFCLKIHLVARTGELSIQSGTTAKIRGTKPDGNIFIASATLDAANAIVTVAGDMQMTAVQGKSLFEIMLTLNGKELNSANFYLRVEPAAADKDSVKSDSVMRDLLDVVEDAETIIRAAENAVSAASAAEQSAKEAKEVAESFDPLTALGLEIVDGALCWVCTQ